MKPMHLTGLIAFTAPIARNMQRKHVGETIIVRTIKGEEELVITDLTYTNG